MQKNMHANNTLRVCMYVCLYICIYVCMYQYSLLNQFGLLYFRSKHYKYVLAYIILTYTHTYTHTCIILTYIHKYIHTCPCGISQPYYYSVDGDFSLWQLPSGSMADIQVQVQCEDEGGVLFWLNETTGEVEPMQLLED